MAAKRAIRSDGKFRTGSSTIFMRHAHCCDTLSVESVYSDCCGFSYIWPRCCGALEPITDRFAEPGLWDRHHGNGGRAKRIERTQVREQVSSRLDHIGAGR